MVLRVRVKTKDKTMTKLTVMSETIIARDNILSYQVNDAIMLQGFAVDTAKETYRIWNTDGKDAAVTFANAQIAFYSNWVKELHGWDAEEALREIARNYTKKLINH